MGLLTDSQILELCVTHNMIENVTTLDQITTYDGHKIMGYGIDSYGYDIKLDSRVEIFTNINGAGTVDPKRPTKYEGRHVAEVHVDEGESYVILPPNSFALGHSTEIFNLPSHVTGVVLGKSTYARAGIIVNPTVLKAGWSGSVVLEFTNSSSLPVRLYVHEGAAHVMFFSGDQVCTKDYSDRGGKYNGQRGVELGRV